MPFALERISIAREETIGALHVQLKDVLLDYHCQTQLVKQHLKKQFLSNSQPRALRLKHSSLDHHNPKPHLLFKENPHDADSETLIIA